MVQPGSSMEDCSKNAITGFPEGFAFFHSPRRFYQSIGCSDDIQRNISWAN
jgi:hypothetical protein